MKKINEKIVYEGKWLSVSETYYENKAGKQLKWESVNRKRSSMGVVVVARLMPSKQYVLIKQYRPAINGYIMSFPAGLGHGDPNHALVELKEETGYVGTIKRISPPLKTGASLINDNAYVVYIEIDENAPVNKNPIQELEDAEDITVCLTTLETGRQFLEEQQAQGVHIASNLWYVFGLNDIFNQ